MAILRFQQELAAWACLEIEALAGVAVDPRQRHLVMDRPLELASAGFIESCVRIELQAPDLPSLRAALDTLPYEVVRGRVRPISCGYAPPILRNDFLWWLEKLRGSLDPKEPLQRYVLASTPEGYFFGPEISCSQTLWEKHRAKPCNFSAALSVQAARTALNLLKPFGRDLLEVGCGSGAATLEACEMGFAVTAIDVQESALVMTRANLEHFGYRAATSLCDARLYEGRHDVALIDLPYGKNSHRSVAMESGILAAILPKVGVAAVFGGFELEPLLQDLRVQILRQTFMEHAYVTRRLYLLRQS